MLQSSEENWQAHRRRMIAETEQFIAWGLRHPELVDWIPAKPASAGEFPGPVAMWFYRTVFSQAGETAQRWRQRLRLGRRR